MLIVNEKINISKLSKIAKNIFGDMVKGVVDVEKEELVIDGELHSDLEAFLLNNGSSQKDLWGINLYPDEEDFIEFDSLINIRPSENNLSRGVLDLELQKKIIKIVSSKIEK